MFETQKFHRKQFNLYRYSEMQMGPFTLDHCTETVDGHSLYLQWGEHNYLFDNNNGCKDKIKQNSNMIGGEKVTQEFLSDHNRAPPNNQMQNRVRMHFSLTPPQHFYLQKGLNKKRRGRSPRGRSEETVVTGKLLLHPCEFWLLAKAVGSEKNQSIDVFTQLVYLTQ